MNKKYMAFGRIELQEYLPYLKAPTLILSIHTYLDSEPRFLKEKIDNVVHVELSSLNSKNSTCTTLSIFSFKNLGSLSK